MSILYLNCWGLGKTQAVKDLHSLMGCHKPCLVFLSETKRSTVAILSAVGNLMVIRGLMRIVQAGLSYLLFFGRLIQVCLLFMAANHIIIIVKWASMTSELRFTGI